MKSYRNPEDNNSEEIRRSQNYVSVHEMLGPALSNLLPFKKAIQKRLKQWIAYRQMVQEPTPAALRPGFWNP